MAGIILHLGDTITPRDVSRVRDTLKTMGPEDEITIQMEAADAHESGRITDELDRQGFDYQPHGGDGHAFYFIARKKSGKA